MSVPLSGSQPFPQQVGGMFGGPRGRVRPRGAYTVMGVGDPNLGYNGYGYYWNTYPGLVSGQQSVQGVSMDTGATVGTPSVTTQDQLKVGGGVLGADTDDASPTQGMSQGGTASY
jgi:hypothetical protein